MAKRGRYGKAKRGEKEQIASICGFWADEYGNVFRKDHSEVKQYEGPGGYLIFTVEGFQVLTHRFVWHCLKGPIPEDQVIDHIDRCRHNAKLENLRCVSHGENLKNRPPRSSWNPTKKKIRL